MFDQNRLLSPREAGQILNVCVKTIHGLSSGANWDVLRFHLIIGGLAQTRLKIL